MKVVTRVKETSFASFAFSAGLHAMAIVAFSVWSHSNENSDLVKFPNAIALNFNEMKGNFKTSSKKEISHSSLPNKSIAKNFERPGPLATTTAAVENVSAGPDGNSEDLLSVKQKYFLEFRGLVENKKEYPAMARMRGIEGVVVVSVTIKRNGEVFNHRLVKESGHDVLDQSALNLVKRIIFFKSIPTEVGIEDIELRFPLAYQLNSQLRK